MSDNQRAHIAIIGYGVVGKGMERLFQKHFYVTHHDVGDELPEWCDLAVICVPTPALPSGQCDISAIESVLENLRASRVLIKSTIPPGTTTYLREKYGMYINFSPEYMGESSYFTPFWKYPDPEKAETHTFVIVGGDEASEILNYFMKVMSVDTKYMAVTAEEAELTKSMENAFFATKVAFCNEYFSISKLWGVDYKKLRELWLLDSRINPNHTLVFEDKRGFGGKCLPKDLTSIIYESEQHGYEPKVLKGAQSWQR